jgi:hypothetical protein
LPYARDVEYFGGMALEVRRTRQSRDMLPPRTAKIVAVVGMLAATAWPPLVWHRAMEMVASNFQLDLKYLLTGWLAYGLIAFGLLMAIPVVYSIGRDPESRFYPRSRNAYAGWAASTYVLGAALASQIAEIATASPAH